MHGTVFDVMYNCTWLSILIQCLVIATIISCENIDFKRTIKS